MSTSTDSPSRRNSSGDYVPPTPAASTVSVGLDYVKTVAASILSPATAAIRYVRGTTEARDRLKKEIGSTYDITIDPTAGLSQDEICNELTRILAECEAAYTLLNTKGRWFGLQPDFSYKADVLESDDVPVRDASGNITEPESCDEDDESTTASSTVYDSEGEVSTEGDASSEGEESTTVPRVTMAEHDAYRFTIASLQDVITSRPGTYAAAEARHQIDQTQFDYCKQLGLLGSDF